MEWNRDGYTISTERERLDLELIRRFLREDAYWSVGIPAEIVDRSIDNSLPFGLYGPRGEQAGFARAVTDRAVFAYLADVFVVPGHRRRGLGVWLVQTVLSHPDLRGLRRFVLATEDAHRLYERFGFRSVAEGSSPLMEVAVPAEELYGDG